MHLNNEVGNKPYRWIMLFLWVIATIIQTFVWLSLSPILSIVSKDLNLNYSQGGSLLSIVMFMGGVALFIGNAIIEKFGIKLSVIIALSFFLIGSLLAYFSNTYFIILIARTFIGVGFGLIISVNGPFVMEWFPTREHSKINTFNMVIANLVQICAFTVTIPLVKEFKEWKNIYLLFSIITLVSILIWFFIGKEKPKSKHSLKEKNQLIESLKRKEIRILMISFLGNVMTFTLFSTFFPIFLQNMRNINMQEAGNITGILPIAGLVGTIICGVGTSKLNKRKPFTWPLFLLVFLGSIIAVISSTKLLIFLGIFFIGFGCGSFPPIMFTIVMEQENSTPKFVSSAIAWIVGLTQMISLVCPLLFNFFNNHFGLQKSFNLFLIFSIASLIASFKIKETAKDINVVKITT